MAPVRKLGKSGRGMEMRSAKEVPRKTEKDRFHLEEPKPLLWARFDFAHSSHKSLCSFHLTSSLVFIKDARLEQGLWPQQACGLYKSSTLLVQNSIAHADQWS